MTKSNTSSRKATFNARAGFGSAIAVASMLSMTAAAQAHSSKPHPFKSASIQWDPGGGGRPTPPALLVGHDGNDYTHLVGEISTRFRLKASVKSGHRIYGYGITTGDPDMADDIPLDLMGFRKGIYEKSIDRHATFKMDANTAVTSGTPGIQLNLVQNIVDMCNSAFSTPPDTDQGAGQIQLTVHGVFSRGDWEGMKFLSWPGAWYPDGAKSRPAYAHTTFPVNVVCLNKNNFRVGQFQPKPQLGFDHGDMLIKDARLFLTTIDTLQNTGHTLGGCKTLKTTVRFETNQTGPVSFDLHRFPGGMTKHTAQAEFEPETGKYYARFHKYETFETTTSVQYMAMSTSPSAGNTGWKGITIHCGGGLTQNPNPNNPDNDIPQGQTLKGDFGFVDYGSPKCERTGKALITFRSPKSDNVHYSLDCKFFSKSGVAPVNPHPDGGYAGAALVSFPITKTVDESCTLRTVAPYGPKDHVTKGHLFQCVTPAFPPATTDLVPETRPDPQGPRNPGKVIVVPPRVVVDPPRGPRTPDKLVVDPAGPDQSGKRTDSTPDYGKKTRHDAEADRKRLELLKKKRAEEARRKAEAEKKKAEAERKRREAAQKAAELQRKREAAKKAAEEAKRKREAAQKAAELKRKREAAKKAAEQKRRLDAARRMQMLQQQKRAPKRQRGTSSAGRRTTPAPMMLHRRR